MDQSAPNLVKMYDYKISDEFDYGFNWTRTVIELSAIEFENLPYLTLFTL